MDEFIQRAANQIRASQHFAVLTGAGVSKESGLPTFRDALDGLWAQYDPMQLATPQAFSHNPKLVWDWYQYRRSRYSSAQPNAGHRALAALERRMPNMLLITQNVDDLHEQAGSRNIVHLHGNISANKCFHNCQGDPTPVDIATLEWDAACGPPPCPHCGRDVRPDVVWFGEQLPLGRLQTAFQFCANADLMLVVGTSGVVTPAADMPFVAKRAGATIIEVNPVESMVTPIADVWLQGLSGALLPLVVEALDAGA